MGSKSNSLEASSLDHLFLNADIANVGDAGGLQNSAAAGSLYPALHTAAPGEGGAQNTSEVSYTGYSRPALARSGAGFTRSGNSITNAAIAAFGQRSDVGSADAKFWSLGTDSSGAGTLLFWTHIGPRSGAGSPKPFTALASDVVTAIAHGLVVNDEVVIYQLMGFTLPTGVSDGSLYFVKTTPDANTLTLSATQGGATLDITADGSGIIARVDKRTITQGVNPQFAIGELEIQEH